MQELGLEGKRKKILYVSFAYRIINFLKNLEIIFINPMID